MIVVGLDPGTVTGIGVWDTVARKLLAVQSCGIVEAMRVVQSWHVNVDGLVIFEDARTIRIGGGANFNRKEKLQGVGSIKRDCAIWEEFLEVEGIAYQGKRWSRGTTKWSADYFKRTTGWTAPTNEHARDAAVIVFGLNQPICAGIVRAWQEQQERKNRSTGKSSPAASMRASPRSPSCPIAGAE